MSMNVRKRYPGKGRNAEVAAEISRIFDIWSSAGRPFLFGEFSAADAMFAPVVFRFVTYGVDLPSQCRAYSDAMLALPAMREWAAAAERETETIPNLDAMYE
jgi:glutathione S-transferase